mgnify:CR=1 FL=1
MDVARRTSALTFRSAPFKSSVCRKRQRHHSSSDPGRAGTRREVDAAAAEMDDESGARAPRSPSPLGYDEATARRAGVDDDDDATASSSRLQQQKQQHRELALGHLQRTVNRFKARLLRFNAVDSASSYLRGLLSTPEGTREVYARLLARIETPVFLKNLENRRRRRDDDEDDDEDAVDEDDDDAPIFDVMDPNWWENATTTTTTTTTTDALVEIQDAVPTTTNLNLNANATARDSDEPGWVVVSRDDAVDAVADFVAAFVSSHPAAADYPPEKMQRALASALRDLQTRGNKTNARRLWDCGVGVYRGCHWTYSAAATATNPLVAQLVLGAVYTSARVACGVASMFVPL